LKAEKFDQIIENQLDICKNVLCRKANEYATNDRLHNFKQAASMQCCHPINALGGMMAKHTISIYDMIAATEKAGSADLYPAGLWEEKITDHINYLLLLKALVSEARGT